MSDFEFLEPTKKKVARCKGLVYRCSVQEFMTEKRLVRQIEFRLLKRRSCPGCDQCGFMLDDLRDRLDPFCSGIYWPQQPKHNGLYSPRVTNITKDWESGIVDDWDVEMVEVPE